MFACQTQNMFPILKSETNARLIQRVYSQDMLQLYKHELYSYHEHMKEAQQTNNPSQYLTKS